MLDKLLADENIPAGAIDALRDAGCDVLSIREIAPGIADAEVLRLAVNQSRLLATFVPELPLTATGKPQKFVMRDKMIQELKLTSARTAYPAIDLMAWLRSPRILGHRPCIATKQGGSGAWLSRKECRLG